MKYLVMICRGHVPLWHKRVNRDVRKFLQYFLPGGAKVNHASLREVARNLHLVFKGQTADDIYDVLAFCLLQAARRYDPHYTDKVRNVVGTINAYFSRRSQFTEDAIRGYLDHDCGSHLRLLVRRGYLVQTFGEDGQPVAFARCVRPAGGLEFVRRPLILT